MTHRATLRARGTVLAVTALIVAATAASAVTLEDFEARTYTDKEGHTLNYRLFKPAKYDAKARYPLVTCLHGSGERGSDNARQITGQPAGPFRFAGEETQAAHPCFVLAPQCPDDMGWSNWRTGFQEKPVWTQQAVLDIIDGLQKEFSVDSTRLYLTGLSMGGFGSWDILAHRPKEFAAAVPICGMGAPERVGTYAKVPIWVFHNQDDGAVPVKGSRDMVAALRAAGGAPGYSEQPTGGHSSWLRAYAEPGLVDWMFSHSTSRTKVDLKDWGGGAPATSKPDAPVVEAKAVPGVTTLTWPAVPGAVAYNIKRSDSPRGRFTTIAALIPTTTDSDPVPTDGKRWYYQVTAVNAKGESKGSNVVEMPTPAVAVETK